MATARFKMSDVGDEVLKEVGIWRETRDETQGQFRRWILCNHPDKNPFANADDYIVVRESMAVYGTKRRADVTVEVVAKKARVPERRVPVNVLLAMDPSTFEANLDATVAVSRAQ